MKAVKPIIFFIILVSFLIAIFLYPQMPAQMAGHWNIKGEVDGYLPKFWGLFLMPILSVVMYLLFIFLPKIDPLKANIAKFRKYYNGFILLLISFLFYLYLLTIFWNLGYRFGLIQFLVPAFSVLFYYVGVLLENAKRNWFIGIRTPWTMSCDKVWDKTHQLAGKLFKISGTVALLGIFLPQFAFWFVLVPVVFSSLYLVVYSYLVYL